MQVDLDKLFQLAKDRYLTLERSGDLMLWNYTNKTQYEKHWTPETLMCRGLITDKDGKIVARPFPKFFNLSEMGPEYKVPNEPFEVTEKMDGSLGILYVDSNGDPALATRGRFDGPQALEGTRILREKYNYHPWIEYPPEFTVLFEIIYPENKIVCDYGDTEDLTILAVIDNETGESLSYEKLQYYFKAMEEVKNYAPPLVKRYDGIKDISELSTMVDDNKEGFVIRFLDSNLRISYLLC